MRARSFPITGASILAVIGLWMPSVLFGQNLVTNGGFETYTALPSNYAQLCLSQGWTAASGACTLTPGCGHPDYFHLLGAAIVRPPAVIFGTTMPHSGGGMIGFTDWYLVGVTNFREYPRFTLSAPMVPGQPYTVSFWTTNGTNTYSGWGANNLGVAFTTAPLVQTCGAPITGVTPQIEITTIVFSSTWQLHTFTYTPTQAYQYMCIGNFRNDASTSSAQMTTGGMGAYYFLDDVVVQPATPLPIELISFDAWRGEHRTVELAWATASERDNVRFDVERSVDGTDFINIGSLPGAGNSAERHDYRSTDTAPENGMNFYRIRQTDIDGHSTTTDVRAVMLDLDAQELTIWPVPSSGEVTVHVGGWKNDDHRMLTVTDMLGRVIWTGQPLAGGSVSVAEILPAGSYTVVLHSDGAVLAKSRCIIQ